MSRKPIPKDIETDILTSSKRRCCLCTGLEGNYSIKKGQIAHLDQNNENFKNENLAFLCLEHHSDFDSTTKQHKNYTIQEVKQYRGQLYYYLENNPNIDIPNTKRIKSNKPYSLILNGVNGFINIKNDKLKELSKFQIEIEFKLFQPNYTGVLVSIDFENSYRYLLLVYYSTEHKAFPGEFHLKYVDESKEINESIITIPQSKMSWNTLQLSIEGNRIQLIMNEFKMTSNYKIENPIIDKIQYGGKSWGDGKGIYLMNYLSYFKVYNAEKNEVVNDLILFHGWEYYKNSHYLEGVTLYGGSTMLLIPE